MENQLYYTHYTFSLHVNSTFFASDSVNGDERQQAETRDIFGYNGKISKRKYWANKLLTSIIGLSSRFDRTYGSSYDHVTEQYQFLNNITQGDIRQNNTAAYLVKHWKVVNGSSMPVSGWITLNSITMILLKTVWW